MKIIYEVMVNTWNGKRGIASDDCIAAYSGIEHDTREAAQEELKKAREETKRDLLVNFLYIDKIERF